MKNINYYQFEDEYLQFCYNCNKLVYYAETNDVWEAIEEEKRIKAGSRLKKVKMIESMNPSWEDLAAPWYD